MTYEQTIQENNLQLIMIICFVIFLGVCLSLLLDYLAYRKLKREINEKQNSTDSSEKDRD